MERQILILVENNYEDLELHYPRLRMVEAGFFPIVAGPKAQEEYKGKYGLPCRSDVSFGEIDGENYAGLIIPGGYAPDKLRRYPPVLKLVQHFHEKKKMLASICHAGWVPISAKVVKGMRYTSVNAIRDDLTNAGAFWVDEPVVVDQHHISSRGPDDLPLFCDAILKQLAKQPAAV